MRLEDWFVTCVDVGSGTIDRLFTRMTGLLADGSLSELVSGDSSKRLGLVLSEGDSIGSLLAVSEGGSGLLLCCQLEFAV
jgi:hypothetical protein